MPGTPWVNCCHKHGYSTPNKVQRYSSLFKHDFFFRCCSGTYTYIPIYIYAILGFQAEKTKKSGYPSYDDTTCGVPKKTMARDGLKTMSFGVSHSLKNEGANGFREALVLSTRGEVLPENKNAEVYMSNNIIGFPIINDQCWMILGHHYFSKKQPYVLLRWLVDQAVYCWLCELVHTFRILRHFSSHLLVDGHVGPRATLVSPLHGR